MNNRGPLFKGDEIDIPKNFLHRFWWGSSSTLEWTHALRPGAVYDVRLDDYKTFPNDILHVSLLDFSPTWKELEAVTNYFYQLNTLIVQKLPTIVPSNGINSKAPLRINVKVIACRFIFDFDTIGNALDNVKHIFCVSMKATLPKSLPNLETFSCVIGSARMLDLIKMPKLENLDVYVLMGEAVPLKFTAKELRIDSKLLESVNLSNVRLLQIYGNIDAKAGEDVLRAIEAAKPRDLIIGKDMLNADKIDDFYTPEVVGAYVEDSNISRYINRFPALNIYSVINSHQFARCTGSFDNFKLVCNFDIFQNSHGWEVLLKAAKALDIVHPIEKTNASWAAPVSARKKTMVSVGHGMVKISITTKTNQMIVNLVNALIANIAIYFNITSISIVLMEFSRDAKEKSEIIAKLQTTAPVSIISEQLES